MVIEGYTWNLLGKRLPQLREIGRALGRDTRHDQARDRQIIELKSASQPWLEQVRGLFLGIGPHLGNAGRSARDDRSLCDLHVDVVTGHRTDLNRDLARHVRLPFTCCGAHQHDRARGQRGQKGHDGDDRDQSPPGNRRLRHDGGIEAHRKRALRVQLLLHRRVSRRHAGDPRAARGGARRFGP